MFTIDKKLTHCKIDVLLSFFLLPIRYVRFLDINFSRSVAHVFFYGLYISDSFNAKRRAPRYIKTGTQRASTMKPCVRCSNTNWTSLGAKARWKDFFHRFSYIRYTPAVNQGVQGAVKKHNSRSVQISRFNACGIPLDLVNKFDAQKRDVTENENA